MDKATKKEIQKKIDDCIDDLAFTKGRLGDISDIIRYEPTDETPQPEQQPVEKPAEPAIVVPTEYKVSDYVGTDSAPIFINSDIFAYFNFIPTEGYGWLSSQFAQALSMISKIICDKYSNRAARMMEIIQACPMQGREFPNNPAHTWDGLCADLHYYTRGETNHTQYSPDGKPLVKIWDDNGKLTPLFDIERNRELVKLFRIICPYGEIVMDERIIEQAGYQDLGITGDKPKYRNHDTHIHMQWKLYRINLGAVIKV